jgi:hypothetical protein
LLGGVGYGRRRRYRRRGTACDSGCFARTRGDGNEGEVSHGATRPAGRLACAARARQSWRAARGPGRPVRLPGRGARKANGWRAHGARSTARDSRIRTPEPCAHGTWPTEPARRSGARDDGGLLSFYFIYRFSKLRNSKILNATQKSPKSKVVEEL